MYFTGPPIERFDLGTAAFIPLMQGIVMFVYSVLDNSDGKQARKIQASSPLGLMMDHGCDILNTGIATITLTRIVSLGNNWMFPIVMIGTLGAFFFATLEEYFVGGLFLPIINGVNEGLMLVIAICIGTFFAPQNWWNTNSFISGFTWNDLLFWFLTIGAVGTIIMNFVNMFKKAPFGDVLAKSSLFIYLTLSFLALFLFTDRKMFAYQIWAAYVYILLTARIVNNLQIAHTSNQEFEQFQPQVIFFCLVMNAFTIYAIVSSPVSFDSCKVFIYFLAAAVALYYAAYVFSVVVILANCLNIRVFSVKPKEDPMQAPDSPPYSQLLKDDHAL